MCPYHHFVSSSSCKYCASFSAGFVNGFLNFGPRLIDGAKRMKAQEGKILSSPGKPEEEENRILGRQIRIIKSVIKNDESWKMGKEVWAQLPEEVRSRLKESGVEGMGSLVGSTSASLSLMYGLSYIGGRIVSTSPKLQPLRAIRHPAIILTGIFISMLSVQGNAAQIINKQNRIFSEYPGSKEIFREVLESVDEEKT